MARIVLVAVVPLAVLATVAGMLFAVFARESNAGEPGRAGPGALDDGIQPGDPYPWSLLAGVPAA